MADLFILGAGGSSREIIDLVQDVNQDGGRWNVCGVLDDDPAKLGQIINGAPVIGPIALAAEQSGFFVTGIASFKNRRARQQIFTRLALARERFATLIHPSAKISRWARIGDGTVIQNYATVGPQATIGSHVIISAMSFVAHHAKIADFVTLAPQVCVAGGAQIDECAYLGAGARIRETVAVGAGALVGIGSVVLDTVGAGDTVFGNPARKVQ